MYVHECMPWFSLHLKRSAALAPLNHFDSIFNGNQISIEWHPVVSSKLVLNVITCSLQNEIRWHEKRKREALCMEFGVNFML